MVGRGTRAHAAEFADVNDVAIVVANCVAFPAASVIVGFSAARVPQSSFDSDNAITRIRTWERHGRTWDKVLRVRHWKDRLPEAGALFGGRSKRSLSGSFATSRSTLVLRGFQAETRRAEIVHWALLAVTPIYWLWNPLVGDVAVTAVNAAIHAPFIVVQRYNRARSAAILARRHNGH